VELHAANGYLIEQFLNANVNQRSGAYGRSIDGRNRFALEVARATATAIGAHRVGIRLSPLRAGAVKHPSSQAGLTVPVRKAHSRPVKPISSHSLARSWLILTWWSACAPVQP